MCGERRGEKGKRGMAALLKKRMVGVEGLEPPACWFEVLRGFVYGIQGFKTAESFNDLAAVFVQVFYCFYPRGGQRGGQSQG
jgi:hypothetical protein